MQRGQERKLVVCCPPIERQVDARGCRADSLFDGDELLVVRFADQSGKRHATWQAIVQTKVAACESQQPTEVIGLFKLERDTLGNNPFEEQGSKFVAVKGETVLCCCVLASKLQSSSFRFFDGVGVGVTAPFSLIECCFIKCCSAAEVARVIWNT